MREYEIFKLLRVTMAAQMPARNGGPIGLALAYQPTPQGAPAPEVAALRMSTASLQRVGWRKSAARWDNTAAAMVNTETQALQHTLQITVIPPAGVPKDGRTEVDICTLTAACMQSDQFIAALGVYGVQVLRVSDVRMGRFRDENNQFANWPNFDLSLTHNDTFINGVPVVAKWEFMLTPVPDLI